jgi:hypothetical protein
MATLGECDGFITVCPRESFSLVKVISQDVDEGNLNVSERCSIMYHSGVITLIERCLNNDA